MLHLVHPDDVQYSAFRQPDSDFHIPAFEWRLIRVQSFINEFGAQSIHEETLRRLDVRYRETNVINASWEMAHLRSSQPRLSSDGKANIGTESLRYYRI
jgi:hypothetical protein